MEAIQGRDLVDIMAALVIFSETFQLFESMIMQYDPT